jgi:protein TonB
MEFAEQQRNPTKHLVGIGFVILFHVFLVYALVTGLARKVVDVIKVPIETKIIQEVKPPPPPERPPPPPPKMAAPPPPFIPPPEIQIAQPPPQQPVIASVQTAPPPPNAPPPVAGPPAEAPPAAAQPVRVAAVIDAARSCTKPEYPAASRRLEETGTVTLRFLIDVDGKVVKSEVESSSGHPRLDDAARDALSRCQFKPGSVDGKPEQSWAKLKYAWKLN